MATPFLVYSLGVIGFAVSFSSCYQTPCSGFADGAMYLLPFGGLAAICFGIYWLSRRKKQRAHEIVRYDTLHDSAVDLPYDNEEVILRLLNTHQQLTIDALCQKTNLDRETIQTIIRNLLAHKLIVQELTDAGPIIKKI